VSVFRPVTCKNSLTDRENATEYSWLEELFLGGCPELGSLGFRFVQPILGTLLTSFAGIRGDGVWDYGRIRISACVTHFWNL
jgi:hypothetical protein